MAESSALALRYSVRTHNQENQQKVAARALVYLIIGPTVSELDCKAQLFNGETARQRISVEQQSNISWATLT
jgi:hypothetical protein